MPSLSFDLKVRDHKIEALKVHYGKKFRKKITLIGLVRILILTQYDTLFDPTYKDYKPDQN